MTESRSIKASNTEASAPPVKGRLGALILASDGSIENDLYSMLPPKYVANFSRMNNYETCDARETDHTSDLIASAKLLRECDGISTIIYGCTSGELTFGRDLITHTIKAVFPDGTVVTPVQAAIDAASSSSIRSLYILTPYDTGLNQRMAAMFEAANIAVSGIYSPPFWTGLDLALIDENELISVVKTVDLVDSEGLFVPCNAIPAVQAIAALERSLALPALTSTQV